MKSVHFSHDDRLLATCGRDKSVWIWERLGDTTTDDEYECVAVLTDHTQDVKCVRWHPTQRLLASCSYDDTIRIYVETGDDWSCVDTLTGHTSTVWAIDFDATGDRLVSCSDDRSLRIWKRQNSKLTESGNWICTCILKISHRNTIYDVNWCKLEDRIASVGRDNALCVFVPTETDPDSYELSIKKVNAHFHDVNSVNWHPLNPDILATGSDDHNIGIWKYSNSPLVQKTFDSD